MCCENSYTPITYKYLPTGDVVFQNKLDKYITLKDTIKGPFDIYLQLDTEKLYAYNFSFIPTATACDVNEPYPLNYSNIEKLSLSIDKSFLYKNSRIEEGANFIDIDDKQYFYVEYRYNPNYIIIDERFLENAKFNKGWTTFYISGELEDGQKFKFEKEVYLDL
jgi:hypothetical protein